MNYIAHKRGESDNAEQPLLEHLKNVSELSEKFAKCLNLSDYADIIGMLHDIGKYSNRFQERINGNEKIKVDHSTCGSQEAFKMKLLMASFCIAGHHGGIPDIGAASDRDEDSTLRGRLKKRTEDYSFWVNEVEQSIFKPINEPFTKDRLPYTFILRFLFSCLVDADYLDTENFMSNGAVSRDSGDELPFLLNLLNKYIDKWKNPIGKLNILRTQMLNECIEVGRKSSDKLFTLTVPTGGGKTISSMAFALNYAVKHRKKRIIYVIPYTSIIEQNAEVFRKIFGMKNVLENHSNLNIDRYDDETKVQMMLAAENWDSPIVVTTAVQFFESLFSSKSSKCRKLHNIANSVIIFDEAQMLPNDYLKPCLAAIEELILNYKVSVVLCTATQPALDPFFKNIKHITELCPRIEEQFEFFGRVQFENAGKLSEKILKERLAKEKQALCIVNTKKRAQEIYNVIKGKGVYHLSTSMYPKHRKRMLRWVLERCIRDHGMQVDAEKIKTASEKLKHTLELIQTCESKAQLRGFEGEAASVYFGVFDEMILQQKKDFSFQGRNKRPPLDNVNAMLSFVYTLLTNTIASSLECVGLDPYVGYLHTERLGRVSLALDMIEELRAVLADRFVLSLVNKKIVSEKNFTKKENGAVLMDDEIRKKLLVEWQKKKKETITHPFLKEKVEWGMVPYVQAMLLARYLRGDLDGYPVFLWK